MISAAHRLQSLVLIPSIHCNRFKILMKDLICGPGTFPAIIPGFDFDSNTLFNFVTELNAFINPTPPPVVPDSSTTEAVAGETGQSPAVETAPESIPIPSDPFYKLLKSMERSSISHLQHLFTAPMSSSATPLTQSMTAMMKELWREFLTYNGLQPVYVVVAGPPKSGKTEHAKSIAQR